MPRKSLCPRGTVVQTLLFDRTKFSETAAKAWARSHGYLSGKVDRKTQTYRLRQYDPSEFVKTSFRTVQFGHGIKAIVACPK